MHKFAFDVLSFFVFLAGIVWSHDVMFSYIHLGDTFNALVAIVAMFIFAWLLGWSISSLVKGDYDD